MFNSIFTFFKNLAKYKGEISSLSPEKVELLIRYKGEIGSLSAEEIEVLSLPRSPFWKKLREEHLRKSPNCSVCGSIKSVVPHHIIPFHVNPQLELDPNNLISLCEGDTFNCHLFFGHFRKWTKHNPDVVQDSLEWSKKIKGI